MAPLLDQVEGTLASFTGDGACDQDGVSAGVAQHHPDAAVIMPPRTTAGPSATTEAAVAVQALNCMLELGRPSCVRVA